MTPQEAIEILKRYKNHWFGDMLHDNGFVTVQQIIDMLTAQPEITDEQAIDHLQATGWMQEHDRQMYEMGIKEQLKDDSGSYDSLIPQDCIHRQDAIDLLLYSTPPMTFLKQSIACHPHSQMET